MVGYWEGWIVVGYWVGVGERDIDSAQDLAGCLYGLGGGNVGDSVVLVGGVVEEDCNMRWEIMAMQWPKKSLKFPNNGGLSEVCLTTSWQ